MLDLFMTRQSARSFCPLLTGTHYMSRELWRSLLVCGCNPFVHTPKVIKVSLLWQGRMLIDKECKPSWSTFCCPMGHWQ